MFRVPLPLSDGATLIETVVHDINGTTVSDTRAVQAGEFRPVGAGEERAIGTADSFTTISAARAAHQAHRHQEAAPADAADPQRRHRGSCAFVSLYLDDLKYSDIQVAVAPAQGGATSTY